MAGPPSPADPAAERVAIVDGENRVVGEAPRARMRAERLPHRATYVFVFHSDGRLLLQRRTTTKDLYPGLLDAAAGGVVAAGESYDECARRELAEELGVEDVEPEPRFDLYWEDDATRCFGRVYTCVHDGPWRLQAEEVAAVELVPVEAVLDGTVGPVTPDTLEALRRLSENFTRAG